MSRTTTLRIATAVVIALSLLITGLLGGPLPTIAFQAPTPPPSDSFLAAPALTGSANASFEDSSTTLEPGEPLGCYMGYGTQHTAWYKFTAPSAGMAQLSVSGVYDNFVVVYRANVANPVGFGDLGGAVFCGAWSPSSSLQMAANDTYYFQLGNLNNYNSGWIYFSFQYTPAPANDNFANAVDITGLPFNVNVNNYLATTESGEPSPSCAPMAHSVWYKYTATETRSVSIGSTSYYASLGVWTGAAVNALSAVGCTSGYNYAPLVAKMQAGKTYYLQLGDMGWCYNCGSIGLNVDFTPPPIASFFYSPLDPSIFDTVQFQDTSYDPVYQGFQSWGWMFGDGGTATGYAATHKYAKDGDYTIEHTATTVDGRTGSVSQVVAVRTHDVAITRLSAPNSAAVNQTKQILASVTSKRQNETVEMQLYKSIPGGSKLVGSYSQYVPVRPPGGKATDFTFNYTFQPEDLAMGKVTFKVVANLANARDALPADNEAVSTPVKVTR